VSTYIPRNRGIPGNTEPEMQMAAISFRWLNIRQQGRTQFEQIVCTKALMHMCEKEGEVKVGEREGKSEKGDI